MRTSAGAGIAVSARSFGGNGLSDASIRIASLAIYPVKSCRGIALQEAWLTARGLRHDRRWMIVDAAGKFRSQRELPQLATLHTVLDGDRLVLGFGSEQAALPLDGDEGEPMSVTLWRDTMTAVRPSAAIDARLSAWLGREVHLVRFPEGCVRPCDAAWAEGTHTAFADGFPVLVAGEGSLAELNDTLREQGAEPVPMTRFRPNIVLAGTPPRAEDRHRRIDLAGGVGLDLVKPCDRCVITTIDQDTGAQDDPRQPIAALRAIRRNPRSGGFSFAQNAVPVLPAGEALLRVGDACRLSRPV